VFHRRRPVRKWRLRGRRAQVSAVATILGLLLVVTFIANYLTATLPGQMSINDLNHVVQVEDQVGRLSALLQAASADDAVGAQLTQPITLGSAGQPPFASADPGSIGPATNGAAFNLTLPIGGAWSYVPPTIGTAGYKGFPSASCTSTATQVTCSGTSIAYWNVSEASGTNLAFTGASGTYNVNIKDSGTNATKASITTTLNNVGTLNLLVLGSNVSIPLTLSGQGTVNIEIVGNYDNLTITDTSGGGNVNLLEVGLHDTTWVPQAAGLNFLANIAGTSDYVRFSGTESALSATTVASVYFLGDTPTTTACPNDNLASSDFVEGGHDLVQNHHGFGGGTTYTSYGSYNVTYNVTSTPVTLSTTPPAQWTEYNVTPEFNALVPEAAYCPLYVQASDPMSLSALGGGTIVHLASTYIPSADVAFDQGAVVYAQEGGIPILLDPPGISYTMSGKELSTLSIWLPIFVGTIPIDSGLSTTEFESRLVSTNTVTFSSGTSLDIAANNNINVTITSPFAAAWVGYFNATYPFDTFSYGCIGPSAACSGPYNTGGPLGTAWIDIATGALLSTVTVQTAVFSVSLV
jgi:hypothetical protein